METRNTFDFISKNEEDTAALGRIIAHIAQKGDVFALFGTLGMGKSVFARAFIQELSNASDVPSPTFTLVQIYEANDFEIFHYDLYRLKSPEEIFEIGLEESVHTGVNLIEWPEMMGPYLPQDIFKINICTTPDGNRKISITSSSPNKLSRLSTIKELTNA